MQNSISLGVSVLILLCGLLWRKAINNKLIADTDLSNKVKRNKSLATMLACIGAYIFLTSLITLLFGVQESHQLEFSLLPERMVVFGFSLSETTLYTWLAMAILIFGAIIIRVTIVTNFKHIPTGKQNVIEAIVETVGRYTIDKVHGTGEFLCSYILTIGSLLLTCAFVELFRVRPPTSDITMTFACALMTFIMINGYGIKRKGVIGRIKSLAEPTPAVFIFRVISDIAIPVSTACRLFGNMLGGMIVIDLLYMSLGNGAIALPSIAGIYFNVAHPLMQTYIFVTLTLTFISEAVE